MKIFLAGASGILGLRLVSLLVERGHDVVGMTRTRAKADALAALGATPVVCDVFDVDARVVLRYGQFYGPGTYFPGAYFPDALPDDHRVSLDRAARATIDHLDSPSAIYTVTD